MRVASSFALEEQLWQLRHVGPSSRQSLGTDHVCFDDSARHTLCSCLVFGHRDPSFVDRTQHRSCKLHRLATASASPLEGLVECNGVTPLAILFYLLPEVLAYGDRDGCIHVATEVIIDIVTSSALPYLPASFIIVVCSK